MTLHPPCLWCRIPIQDPTRRKYCSPSCTQKYNNAKYHPTKVQVSEGNRKWNKLVV